MLTISELAERIRGLLAGRESLVEFEDWFSVHSRKFHRSGDPKLIDFVSAVESVFSRFYFGGLDETGATIALGEQGGKFASPLSADPIVGLVLHSSRTDDLSPETSKGSSMFDVYGPKRKGASSSFPANYFAGRVA